MSHTPGPWKHLGGSYAGRVVNESREVVATVNGVSRGGRGRLSNSVANANARLIAACPDMLEALQFFAECDHLHHIDPKLTGALLDALAKAEGRTK